MPTLEGYTFSGWTGEVTTMPDNDVTVTGSWEASSDISDDSRFEVSNPTDVVYNGSEQKQAVTITDKISGKELTAGTDFTLTYSSDTTNVGTVTVTVTGIGSYTGVVTKTYNINPAAVTVTADAKEMTQGADVPELTATVEGLFGSDSVEFTLSTEATKTSAPGEYPITVTGEETQGNYTVTFKPGTLTITQAEEIIVTISGVADTVLYDGAGHAVIGFHATSNNAEYNEFVDENNPRNYKFEGTIEVAGLNVGTYQIDLSNVKFTNTNPEKYPNVTFRFNPANHHNTLTILPRTVVMTSATQEKLYDGQPLSDVTVNVTGDGFAPGEGATYTADGATQTDAGSVANSFNYQLNAGTLPGNYIINKQTGTLTILPRTVILTSASAEKDYDGEPLVNETVTVTGDGFIEGEGATWTVTGQQTEEGSSENFFTYTLNAGTKPVNYDITTAFGTLTVRGAEEILDDDTPLARGPGANAWALINLISMILTVCVALGMIITYFKKKKDEEEDEKTGKVKRELTEEEEEKKERRKSKFLGLIPGIGSVVAFFLTEDLSGRMVLTDRWTVLMLAILVIGGALAYLTRNEKDKDEEKPEEA